MMQEVKLDSLISVKYTRLLVYLNNRIYKIKKILKIIIKYNISQYSHKFSD